MKRKNSKVKKGFSLVEMLVAVFIFLIVMTAVVTIFARQSESFSYLRIQQRNTENAQFAINFIAKTLRTSTIVGDPLLGTNPSETDIHVFDYSQDLCFRFQFDNTLGTLTVTSRLPDPSDKLSCGRPSWMNPADPSFSGEHYELTTGFVRGSFHTLETTRDYDPLAIGNQFRIGFITMRLEISDTNPATSRKIWIQSSVSLRDYPAELKF